MKIILKDNSNNERILNQLTIGKEYEVLKEDESY